jgi:hypothetical protein
MKNKVHKNAEEAQRIAGGMANQTKGRARVFQNRKKEDSRKACRGRFKGEA